MTCTEKRPNGKTYRARKPPELQFFTGDWPDEDSAIVIRAGRDQQENARQMVIKEAPRHGVELVNQGVFGWWREAVRNNETQWVYDDAKGMPGWFFNVE